jgi:hypothetical protein
MARAKGTPSLERTVSAGDRARRERPEDSQWIGLLAAAIAKALEEPLYRTGALAGTLAAQRKRPGLSWAARESFSHARRLCAEVRRRARRAQKRHA